MAQEHSVREFVSMLAHELKAPLNAIEGYLRIIKDRAAGEELAAYDEMLDRSFVRAQQMRKMIDGLLDMTGIESGTRKRELALVDVREVAQAAIDTAAPGAADRNIHIALDAKEAVNLQADRAELEIILNNLLSNAIKYNRDGGSVNVRLSCRDGVALIEVADTGIGMTGDEAARLFSDFVRIKNDKTRNIPGSGLGLSIVRKLAQIYGGSVNVQSQPDEGSTFTVTLKNAAAA